MSIGIGDFVRLNQGFPLMNILEGDRGVVIGVAPHGQWVVLVEGDLPVVPRYFPAAVLDVIESAAKRSSILLDT